MSSTAGLPPQLPEGVVPRIGRIAVVAYVASSSVVFGTFVYGFSQFNPPALALWLLGLLMPVGLVAIWTYQRKSGQDLITRLVRIDYDNADASTRQMASFPFFLVGMAYRRSKRSSHWGDVGHLRRWIVTFQWSVLIAYLALGTIGAASFILAAGSDAKPAEGVAALCEQHSPPYYATSYVLWQLADAVPIVKVPDTTNWKLDCTFTDVRSGVIVLAFILLLAVPVFAVIFKVVKAFLENDTTVHDTGA